MESTCLGLSLASVPCSPAKHLGGVRNTLPSLKLRYRNTSLGALQNPVKLLYRENQQRHAWWPFDEILHAYDRTARCTCAGGVKGIVCEKM